MRSQAEKGWLADSWSTYAPEALDVNERLAEAWTPLSMSDRDGYWQERLSAHDSFLDSSAVCAWRSTSPRVIPIDDRGFLPAGTFDSCWGSSTTTRPGPARPRVRRRPARWSPDRHSNACSNSITAHRQVPAPAHAETKVTQVVSARRFNLGVLDANQLELPTA